MKDLDFDELDKAVNSLMTDASKTQPAAPPADAPKEEKTLDITPTLRDDTPPSFDKLNEATAKTAGTVESAAATLPQKKEEQPEATSVSTPPATRRGGRFMDMVHPSADMKKPDAPVRVSRQGVTIAPTNAVNTDPEPKSEPKKPDSPVQMSDTAQPKPAELELEKPTPLAVPSEPPVETHAPAKSDWPDPLEMAGFKDDKDEEKSEPKSADAETARAANGEVPSVVSDVPDETEKNEPSERESKNEKENDQPLTSPFLSDAKVEKRPLGGNVSVAEAEEPSHTPVLGAASEEKKSIDDPMAQLPASPTDVEPELPEELQSDLVAIEADTSTHSQPASSESTVPSKEKEETPEASTEATSTPKASQDSRSQDEKLLTAGPTSIPQQYREEESTGDKANGAIYDTDTYHQPLAHPAKKRSGWLVVVWIIVILLLGAGSGAALYLSGIV